MSDPVLQALQVTKVFGDIWGRPRVRAVDELSLEVAPGEVVGLLGPNGAGKSTAIKLFLGLLRPSSGKLAVFSREPGDREARRRTGYLAEETKLHKFLTASETLDFFGNLLGLERAERRKRTGSLLEMVGLARAHDRAVGEMSKGMARRIGLAVALVGDPDLLVLDEPTSGLDPIGTREVKDLLVELASRGKTILLSSHLLADVEDACDRIAILYGGRLRAVGKTQDLLARDNRIQLELDRPSDDALRALEAAARAAAGDGAVSIAAPRDRLEAFFLRVVGAARAEDADTGGAHAGGKVADFLGARDPVSSLPRGGTSAESSLPRGRTSAESSLPRGGTSAESSLPRGGTSAESSLPRRGRAGEGGEGASPETKAPAPEPVTAPVSVPVTVSVPVVVETRREPAVLERVARAPAEIVKELPPP
ncbi:ABC transporter ATP-binding protein, partial [bacterium]|nr:ABC transporter ATP-binding protein [bacterium]